EALQTVFSKQPLQFMIDGKTVVIQPRETPKVVLQARRVTGTIADKEGNPLPGATITLKGTAITTQADSKGQFAISVTQESSVLVVTMVGYESREVTVKPGASVNIVLEESLSRLDEVVVIGYGTQEKRDITGAITS